MEMEMEMGNGEERGSESDSVGRAKGGEWVVVAPRTNGGARVTVTEVLGTECHRRISCNL